MTLITPGFTPEYEILSIRPRSLFGSHPEQKVPYLPLASIRARFETLPVNEVYSEYRKHEIVDVGVPFSALSPARSLHFLLPTRVHTTGTCPLLRIIAADLERTLSGIAIESHAKNPGQV